jgi:hypothetical protein
MKSTPPKLPRVDWKMPDRPQEHCEECGRPIVPIMYSEDGWELWWGCNNDGCSVGHGGYGVLTLGEMEKALIPWPFGEDDTATADELVALGFEGWAV